MQGSSDGAEGVEGVVSAHGTARNADQAQHLSFELIEAHQIERILQNPADRSVVLRGSRMTPSAAFTASLSSNIFAVFCFVVEGEGQFVLTEIEHRGLGSGVGRAAERGFDGAPGKTALPDTAWKTEDGNDRRFALMLCHSWLDASEKRKVRLPPRLKQIVKTLLAVR